jgi:nucleoside-diphosphate-sugar epimerase
LVSPERRGQALAGQPLTVFGDGKQTRSLCYVSDLVEGFLRLMERDQNDVAELVDHGSGRLHRVVDVVFWIVPDLGESRLRRRNHCTHARTSCRSVSRWKRKSTKSSTSAAYSGSFLGTSGPSPADADVGDLSPLRGAR